MSNFFGNFIDQTVTRTMGTLKNLGVGAAASIQANATGLVSSAITSQLSNTLSPVANAINNVVPGTGRILGELIASTVGRYGTSNTALFGGNPLGQAIPGTNIQYNRVVYNTSVFEISSSTVPIMEYSGLASDVQGDIPPQYVITVQNSYNKVVRAALQESFVLDTTSDWIPFLNPKISDNLVKLGALFHMSLFPRWASRRVWRGTSPIRMKLVLKFEAVHDSYQEVVLPCMRLMQMSLPNDGGIKPFGFNQNLPQFTIPVLEPPGPSPFILSENVNSTFDTGNLTDPINKFNQIVASGSDQIKIRIGRLMEFYNVIVESVRVEYPNKFGQDGRPVEAKVELNFSTYEIYTKQAIEAAHTTEG